MLLYISLPTIKMCTDNTYNFNVLWTAGLLDNVYRLAFDTRISPD